MDAQQAGPQTERKRRASDHPWEMPARFLLGGVFAIAAIVFARDGLDVWGGAFLVACGAMFRVDLGAALRRVGGRE